MKRLLVWLTVLALALSAAALPVGASAEQGDRTGMYLVVSHGCMQVGEEVTVRLAVNGSAQPGQIYFDVHCCYDRSLGENRQAARILGGRTVEWLDWFSDWESLTCEAWYSMAPTTSRTLRFEALIPGEFYVVAYTYMDGMDYNVFGPSMLAYEAGDVYDPDSLYSQVDTILRTSIRDGMTDREKALALHNWVTRHSRYGDGRSAVGMLVNHQGVCEAYARLYSLLCTAAGLKCANVNGCIKDMEDGWHEWNAVRINGQWLHVDCTWDDPGIGGDLNSGNECWHYFMIESARIARERTWDVFPE